MAGYYEVVKPNVFTWVDSSGASWEISQENAGTGFYVVCVRHILGMHSTFSLCGIHANRPRSSLQFDVDGVIQWIVSSDFEDDETAFDVSVSGNAVYVGGAYRG